MEDADGPLEGAAQENIAARFGRLKVADAGSVGLPGKQLTQLAQARAPNLILRPLQLGDVEIWIFTSNACLGDVQQKEVISGKFFCSMPGGTVRRTCTQGMV